MVSADQKNILLVDDNTVNRYTVARHLARSGYRVIEAGTAEDAFRVVKTGVDLVILDVKLPDMSGLEVSRMLRENPITRTIPILHISATFTLSSDKVRGLDAGADGYLASPIEPEELLAHVRMLLRLKAAQDALANSNEQLRVHVQELQSAKEELARARDQLSRQNEWLEARVHERTAKLEDTINDLETFSYSITHDMRAPLRAMQGFSKVLLESHGHMLDAEAQDFLNRIANSANRLDLLIRDVLSYSNIIRAPLTLVPINTDKLLRDILREYPGFQPPEAEIQIEGTLPPVMANEAFLSQCFSNLLTNAVKFTQPGVRPLIRVWAQNELPMVRLNFKDNGIGIAPEHQHRIFSLFHRGHNSYPGTGVGLAVVRKAVERMGGTVGLKSSAGEGSTFWIELRQEGSPGEG